MHINSLTLCPLTDRLIFKDRLNYSITSPSTSTSTSTSSPSSRHPERKAAAAADNSNYSSENSFSLEAAFDSRFDINFDLKMNHQYHSLPNWKSTHRTHDDDDSRSKASNSKVRGVSSSRRPQTPPASNISRPSSPGGNSFLSRQYEMMGKKTPMMLAASLRRPLFGKDGLRYGSDDDQRLEEEHHVAVDDNYDDGDVDEYHHRSHSRPSGSRRGSLKEFFRRGSQELVHAADIIVAPKRDREAWITEENARLEKEFQTQLEKEKEKEKEKARLVVLPPPPPLPLKVKRNAAEPRHHRHPRAAGTIGPTTTPPPPARPTPPPRSKGLTRGEDFAIFISRAVDPLKKKKNQGRSRKDSSDSLTCLDAVVVVDTSDEYARCDGCKMVMNFSVARPLKYGLCESCWNVRFVKAPREGNWI